jgi:hypothetical protein
MAVTELSKAVSRKIHIDGKGDFVVTISPDGVSIRMFRKQKSVELPFEELAKRGLEQAAYLLSAKEWQDPLRTLGKLGRLKQR